MKRILTYMRKLLILCIVLSAFMSITAFADSSGGNKLPQAQNLRWSDTIAIWESVEGANRYEVILYDENDHEITEGTTQNTYYDFGNYAYDGTSFQVIAWGNDSFSIATGPKKESVFIINNVQVSGFVKPEPGKAPITKADLKVPEGAKYYVDRVIWYVYPNDSVPAYNLAVFEPEKDYRMVAVLKPVDDAEFPDGPSGYTQFGTFTLNGNIDLLDAAYCKVNRKDDCRMSTAYFTATHTHISGDWIIDQPATATTEGTKHKVCSICQVVTETGTIPKLNPSGQGTPVNLGTVTQMEQNVQTLSENGDLKGADYGTLQLKAKKRTKSSVMLTWKSVPGAVKYIIYGNECGTKYTKLAEVTSTSWTHSELKKGTYYKYMIAASDASDNVVAATVSIHVPTTGGKYGNQTSVSLNKKKVTLQKGKSVKLKAKVKKKGGKVLNHRKFIYESSNPKVATVDQKGTVKAVGAGTCTIYAYAQNGLNGASKITVK